MSDEIIVIVQGLDSTVNNEMLRSIFGRYNCTKCRIVWRKNYFVGIAGINFTNMQDANRAIDEVNGTLIHGREVTLRIANEKDKEWFQKPKKKKPAFTPMPSQFQGSPPHPSTSFHDSPPHSTAFQGSPPHPSGQYQGSPPHPSYQSSQPSYQGSQSQQSYQSQQQSFQGSPTQQFQGSPPHPSGQYQGSPPHPSGQYQGSHSSQFQGQQSHFSQFQGAPPQTGSQFQTAPRQMQGQTQFGQGGPMRASQQQGQPFNPHQFPHNMPFSGPSTQSSLSQSSLSQPSLSQSSMTPSSTQQQQQQPSQHQNDEDTPYPFDAIQDITEFPFCIIEFQTAAPSMGGFVLPCEVAVVVFTIASGEQKIFHRFIEPGQIPVSFIGDAKWISENKTGIPYKEFQQGEKNYSKLWMELDAFLQSALPQKPFPAMWTKAPWYDNKCLKWLSDRAGKPNPYKAIREIEEICVHLHKLANVYKPSSAINDYFSIDAVSKFTGKGKCEFHGQQKGQTFQCALANARAMADIIKLLANTLNVKRGKFF